MELVLCSLASCYVYNSEATTVNAVRVKIELSSNFFSFRRRRHKSDPPCLDVATSLSYDQSLKVSLSVGVSPAAAMVDRTNVSVCGIEADELRLKLESSIKNEKALSQR